MPAGRHINMTAALLEADSHLKGGNVLDVVYVDEGLRLFSQTEGVVSVVENYELLWETKAIYGQQEVVFSVN